MKLCGKLFKAHLPLVAVLWFAATINPANAATVEYIHSDVLGSPVAVTNESAQVIERTEYEPYGTMIGKPNADRAGFTGHVMDSVTSLTYMQQRYYDPMIGRFLSNDPVQAHPNTGASFNRYWYANNNPYKFTDPDGRQSYGYGTNQPAQILDCNQTSSCVSLEEADERVRQDARQVVGFIGTTALIGGTGGLAVETGAAASAAASAAKAVKSNTAKHVLCAALSIGCDGKNIGTQPESQAVEDAVRVAEMFRRMVERLTKEPTTIPKPAPPKPSPPKPIKPPPPPKLPKPIAAK